MDALNNFIYVVSGQVGSEHVVIKAFRSYEAAVAFKTECDARWADKGWRHFISPTIVEG